MNKLRNSLFLGLICSALIFTGCSDDDVPEEENLVEVFTDVTLVFTPAGGGTAIRAAAQDPDGAGSQPLVVQDAITLTSGEIYSLTFEIFNNLETPGEDIGAEILDEDNEHQFFFGFTDGAFMNPAGDGNIDVASDPINYNDVDENGWNVGLITGWTAGDALTDGTFRVRLQHQPDVKTATTGSTDGDTDFDLSFVLNIQ